MRLLPFNMLPEDMQNESVKKYHDILKDKRISLVLKRVFDIIMSFIMIIILVPIFILLGIIIKIDSKGPIIFKQIRITQYKREFYIYKFRTMIQDAEKVGSQVTTNKDSRVTRVGKVIRKYRLDELPQLFNILKGEMTFVGTRPEVPKYVNFYTEEMMATLLLPAGITSEASIFYKDEDRLLEGVENIDKVYIEKVLPKKMSYNLKAINKFNFLYEMKVMIKTVLAVLGKNYNGE